MGVDLRACMARRRAGTSDAVTDVVCAYGSDHPLTQYFSNSAYVTHVLIVCWFKVILYITVPLPPSSHVHTCILTPDIPPWVPKQPHLPGL